MTKVRKTFDFNSQLQLSRCNKHGQFLLNLMNRADSMWKLGDQSDASSILSLLLNEIAISSKTIFHMDDCFGGTLNHRITCLHCSRASRRRALMWIHYSHARYFQGGQVFTLPKFSVFEDFQNRQKFRF